MSSDELCNKNKLADWSYSADIFYRVITRKRSVPECRSNLHVLLKLKLFNLRPQIFPIWIHALYQFVFELPSKALNSLFFSNGSLYSIIELVLNTNDAVVFRGETIGIGFCAMLPYTLL